MKILRTFVPLFLLTLHLLIANNLFARSFSGWDEPVKGWDLLVDFDDFPKNLKGNSNAALDGNWDHDNGSDQWDGSEPGEKGKAPGGVILETVPGEGDPSGDAIVLTIEDTGDPRNNGFADPGSNRKIYLEHDLKIKDSLLDDGVTFIARWRVDPNPIDAPADGTDLHDGGKGQVGIVQANPVAHFAMALDQGAVLNIPDGKIIDIKNEKEFQTAWVTIEKSGGQHEVNIYLNGSTKATFSDKLLLGDGNDSNFSTYITIGLGSTGRDGAIQIDYVGYKVGVFEPSPFAVEPRDKLSTTWATIKAGY